MYILQEVSLMGKVVHFWGKCGDSVDEVKRDKICHNVDCLALPIFSIIYALSVISYFTVLLG